MVYGIRNIVSEDALEKIDIASAYYNVIKEDYTILGDEYLNEAFDINKIKSVIKNKLSKLVETIKKLIAKLIEGIKKAVSTVKEIYKKEQYESKLKKLEKIFKDPKSTITINSPEPDFNPEYGKFVNSVNEVMEATLDCAKNELFLNDNKKLYELDIAEESITDRMSKIHELFIDCFNRYEDKIKEYEDYDIDSIFFKSKDTKDIKITKKYVDNITDTLQRGDLSERIINLYKNSVDRINNTYKAVEKGFNGIASCTTVKNGTKEQEDGFRSKIIEEYSVFGSKLLQRCCSVQSNISTKIYSSYKEYINTLQSMIKKILKVGHADVDKDIYGNWEPSGLLIRALVEKPINIEDIRGALEGSITADPEFETDDFEKSIQYALNNGVSANELYEKYEDNIGNNDGYGKITDDKSKWDYDYYVEQRLALKYNFSRKRIDHIEAVAKKLYG